MLYDYRYRAEDEIAEVISDLYVATDDQEALDIAISKVGFMLESVYAHDENAQDGLRAVFKSDGSDADEL